MNAAHSALEPCGDSVECPQCFNNIIDDRGFVLMLTPKVATQSIVQAYKQSKPRTQPKFRSKLAVEKVMLEHLVIGFIRNPFDRLVSCWKDRCNNRLHRTFPTYGIRQGMEFAEFVDVVTNTPHTQADKHWRPMSYDLITSDGVLIAHYLVRYENLEEGFKAVTGYIKSETDVQLGTLPHINASGKGNYKEYYTQELIDKVAAYYRDDLENFNYGI